MEAVCISFLENISHEKQVVFLIYNHSFEEHEHPKNFLEQRLLKGGKKINNDISKYFDSKN